MNYTRRSSALFSAVLTLVIAALLVVATGCSKEPAWKAVNDKLIQEKEIEVRVRDDIPKNKDITPSLQDGVVTNINTANEVEIAPGCTARMYWGKGNLISWMKLEPNAEIPTETLANNRVMVVWKGSVQQMIKGKFVDMVAIDAVPIDGTHGTLPKKEFVYIELGQDNAVKAGPEGAEILEAYWPVRLDYMAKAGAKIPMSVQPSKFPVKPSIKPNEVYDYYDLQFTELVPGANSRLITLPGMQLSFLRMDPGSVFGHHNHPEEQAMIVLRGSIDEIILDGVKTMTKGDMLYLPAFLVHGGTNGPLGCDVLDVFYPARPDYNENMEKRLAAYHSIIPEDAKVELVVDGATQGPGITFGEGPSWLDGKLYFSSMYFDQAWGGDPKKSALIELDPSGEYKRIIDGKMQTNGTMPLGNGNLAVCDMFGHRIIEVTTTGRIVRTLVNKYNGKSLDGPNDLVIDAKGGIYFTDPQFTPDAEKNQGWPARSVYYRKPNGQVIRVIEPNEFAMPNGVLLSPDGKTLYVNNTYDDETWWNVDSDKDNWIWAYDVNEDGTLSNGTAKFQLYLTPDVLDRKGKSSSADGMTIDAAGHVYVATQIGIQIFCPVQNSLLGIINFPVMPVSCCFGGDDMSDLYAVAYDKVYRIKTKMTGLEYPLK